MRVTTALTLVIFPVVAFTRWQVIQPFWKEFETVVHDCQETKPEHPEQQKNCRPQGGGGTLLIPGVL